MSDDQPVKKRSRVHESPAVNIDSLPDAVLQVCFSFIGLGNYILLLVLVVAFEKFIAANTRRRQCGRRRHRQFLVLTSAGKILYQDPDEIALVAIGKGDLKVLEWARVHHCHFAPGLFIYAAENGHVGVFQVGS